ncbi:DUF192 domain-containing protein [uncultured Sphingomonas sp.]|uniref:DUF192 domain-containing protein n=1 Tax=uncultured Sphingomonas sp. TaxID=158754 RepID=UPI0025E67846|nr:DUF192 domain-containing protein [uncultured Sphingomonas sp.]
MKALLFAALLGAAVPLQPVVAEAFDRAQHLPAQPLTITGDRTSHRFQVEVARSQQQQAIGLMFREVIPADHGMIFPLQPPRMASFWMKNTLASLDLLFVRADGTISSISPNATPLSLAPIESIEPVAAVLELKGGEAARRGIKPGDRVNWQGSSLRDRPQAG